jgi:GNAT superfamily N-acetyltransferase
VTYRIKRVDGTDDEVADTLRWMHNVCFGKSAPQVEPENDYWWIAYLGKEPAAFAALSHATRTPKLGYLKRVGVLPEHRGQRLQFRLIRVREAHARKVGMDAMVSDTTNNPASANTLIRAGYTLYSPQHPWAFDCNLGRHSLYWEKTL